MRTLSDQQLLALHAVHVLVWSFTLPSARVAWLDLVSRHRQSLSGDAFARLRRPISAMLAADSPPEWEFARADAERALAQLHTAWAAAVITGLAVKRVA